MLADTEVEGELDDSNVKKDARGVTVTEKVLGRDAVAVFVLPPLPSSPMGDAVGGDVPELVVEGEGDMVSSRTYSQSDALPQSTPSSTSATVEGEGGGGRVNWLCAQCCAPCRHRDPM